MFEVKSEQKLPGGGYADVRQCGSWQTVAEGLAWFLQRRRRRFGI